MLYVIYLSNFCRYASDTMVFNFYLLLFLFYYFVVEVLERMMCIPRKEAFSAPLDDCCLLLRIEYQISSAGAKTTCSCVGIQIASSSKISSQRLSILTIYIPTQISQNLNKNCTNVEIVNVNLP